MVNAALPGQKRKGETDMMKEKVRRLWECCFNDSKEFTDLYFRMRYSDDINLVMQSDGEVIAALQVLPYPMTFGQEIVKTGYISGACTHPEHRNRGVMHRLLAQAFGQMWRQGTVLSTLIPAEPWLFDYYARCGYAPVFGYRKETFHASTTPPTTDENGFTLHTTDTFHRPAYQYLDCKLRERPCCVLHTEQDFRAILADMNLSDGHLFTLLDAGEEIVALAVAYPDENGHWHIGELVADAEETGNLLLRHVCHSLHTPSVDVFLPPVPRSADSHPLGMARIVNAGSMLQLYAACHPELDICICLTDGELEANNGCYHLHNGVCTKSAKRLPGSHLALTVGELTGMIFATTSPYMSLMMN